MKKNPSFSAWAWSCVGPALTNTCSLFLLALARKADECGGSPVVFLQDADSRQVGFSPKSAQRAVQALVQLGLISTQRRWDPETGATLPVLFTLHTDRSIGADQ